MLTFGNPVRPVPEFGPATHNSDPEAERQDGPTRPPASFPTVRAKPTPRWSTQGSVSSTGRDREPRKSRVTGGWALRKGDFRSESAGSSRGACPPPSWLRLKTFFGSRPAFPPRLRGPPVHPQARTRGQNAAGRLRGLPSHRRLSQPRGQAWRAVARSSAGPADSPLAASAQRVPGGTGQRAPPARTRQRSRY